MKTISSITWTVLPYISYVSLFLMLCGVAWFGQFLVRTASKRPDDNNFPALIWRGSATRLALKLFCTGAGLQILTIIVAAIVPGRN